MVKSNLPGGRMLLFNLAFSTFQSLQGPAALGLLTFTLGDDQTIAFDDGDYNIGHIMSMDKSPKNSPELVGLREDLFKILEGIRAPNQPHKM